MPMESVSLTDVWAVVAAVIGGWILLVNGAEKLMSVYRAARAPNAAQDEEIEGLKTRMNAVEEKLSNDKRRLDNFDDGNRATQRALLALLDHGIDGNNIDQMRHAKEELQNHLINR